tara:strand:+ start:109 stop:705 length:597 start_codon:yes stop_codon:yes gene_type:complete
MKRLLLILILTFSFQTSTRADDIRDFQIEGMSLGDSLLDHYNEKKIKKSIKRTYQGYPNSDEFFRISFKSKVKEYDFIGLHLKKNDFRYIVYSISGQKNMRFSKCTKKSKTIEKDLKKILGENYKSTSREVKHSYDKTGKSINLEIYFTPVTNDDFWPALINCTDWSDAMTKSHNFSDSLSINLNSKDFSNFMFYEAY